MRTQRETPALQALLRQLAGIEEGEVVTWTMKDLREAIRLRRAGWTYGHIARTLGRPRRQVWSTVRYHAPDLRTSRPAFDALACRLGRLHADGYTDAESARRLGLNPCTVRKWRRRLGLATNRGHPRQREKCRRRLRAAVHAAGKATLVAVWVEVRRAGAARAGWPDATGPQEVQVLDLLCDRGPLTTRQLAGARGRSRAATWRILAGLVRRGLVVRFEGARAEIPGGRTESLYRLADGVGRHVPTRERSEGRVPRYREREG